MFRLGDRFDNRCRGRAVQVRAVTLTLAPGRWRLSSTLDQSAVSMKYHPAVGERDLLRVRSNELMK